MEINIMANLGTKLKALLAAGLIGTAGLGMQSCSNPSDSVYYPYTVEAPSTDNPGSGGAENPNPSGGDRGETVDKFKELGITDENVKEIIAYTTTVETISASVNFLKYEMAPIGPVYLYKGTDEGFQNVLEMNDSDTPMDLIGYAQNDNYYYIPESMKDSFIDAIKAYKDSQSNQ